MSRVEVTEVDAWRRWLLAHHAEATEVWVVTYKKHTGDRYLAIGELIREALCFGWIDSQSQGVDADRTSHRFTPRKPGSPWSGLNKQLIAELQAEGRMHPAGQALVDAARADGSWVFLDDVEALIEPADLAAALDANPDARHYWATFPPSTRRDCLLWVKTAKRRPTRDRRIASIVARSAVGMRPR